MAFNDAKKFADKLRIKNMGLFDQGDPKARRGRCWSPWCGHWVEDMASDMRCHEPKCDQRLWQEAVKQRMALYDAESHTYIGCVDGLLVEPTFHVPAEYWPAEIKNNPDLCVMCGENMKRLTSELCVKCHLEGKAAAYNTQRRKVQCGSGNKIKGLDKLIAKFNKK